MKVLKSILLSLFLIGILSSFKAPKNSPVAINGKLQVVGTQLSNEQGNALVLRGASLGWHNLWPRFYNKKTVAWLATDWKCKFSSRLQVLCRGIEMRFANPYET